MTNRETSSSPAWLEGRYDSTSGVGLIVVDMQNDFCHPEGAAAQSGADLSGVPGVVKRIQSLQHAAFDHRLPVVHIRTTHSSWSDSPVWRRRGSTGSTLDIASAPMVQEGSWGAEPYGIEASTQDRVIIKHRYSGFYMTPLELALRSRNIDCVVITGVQTDVCVLQTAMDSLFRGVLPIIASDATASGNADRHESGLRSLSATAGGVAATEDILRWWEGLPTSSNG